MMVNLERRRGHVGCLETSLTIQATKHRYKQTDNINHFLKLVRSVGMPEVSRSLHTTGVHS